MDCSQILPGAVNSGPCSLATGYYSDQPFIVYASGMDIVIVDGRLKHVQTILGSDLGYGDTPITCVHCAELVGKIAIAWRSDVVVFHPSPLDENQTQTNNEFAAQWQLSTTVSLDYLVLSLSWNKEGRQLLVGGDLITLWTFSPPGDVQTPDREGAAGMGLGPGGGEGEGRCAEEWRCKLACPTMHLNFSPDGAMFATAGENDYFVKIWYLSKPGCGGLGNGRMFSFSYVAHPMTVTGLAWRKTSSFMPKGCVPNVLLTYCNDNICRIWSHTVTKDQTTRIHFFITASIDPIADIPFRSMVPIDSMPFLVHWLNNKETTFTSKAEKTQKGAFLPISRHSSLASFASSINEEMLQSWVCIEDMMPSSDDNQSDTEPPRKLPHVIALDNYLRPSSIPTQQRGSPARQDAGMARTPVAKIFAQLMDEWCNSPDLLLCIHPGTGSLMVWTVEGLDSAHTTSRLVHISFSSCLPHIFPPHLAQSLHQGLLQYLIKEPDVVHTREMALTGSLADISIPVPQIRLPSGGTVTGSMTDILKLKMDVPKMKADTSLILVSSHQNGSIHAWSVELTVQNNYYTSIAGLIHWGGTGGHHSVVRAVYRHPWLPVLMTVSTENGEEEEEEEGEGGVGEEGRGEGTKGAREKKKRVDNELIIWNAHLPGPLEHKSLLHELSRMSSSSPLSFRHITWVPPISISAAKKKGALARSPSTGLFVSNVGKELWLFQTSLYSSSKASSRPRGTRYGPPQPDVYITSHFGKEGIRALGVVERDISCFDEIVSLHAFRLCSLVTSADIKKRLDAKFSNNIVITLIENRASQTPPPSTDDSGAGTKHSYLHVWRVVISTYQVPSTPTSRSTQPHTTAPTHSTENGYQASVEKVLCTALPLHHGTHITHSEAACDIASSLQLQLPTLSAAFLCSTACSDGTIHCWQLSAKCASEPDGETHSETLEFELHEVVVGSSSSPSDEYSYRRSSGLDLRQKEVLKGFPLQSDVPCSISNAYAGRMALAHLLTHAPDGPNLSRRSTANPLGRYAAVTVWECESTGGLKWLCEATLLLAGVGGISSEAKRTEVSVHLNWLPMENGAYLLATCFESIISIFGMALPQVEGDFTQLVASQGNSFLPNQASSSILRTESSKVSWICLLQFPCAKRYPGLSISQFSYTGSNSLLISVGTEIHIYSCMVQGSKLEAFIPTHGNQRILPKAPSRVFRRKNIANESEKLHDSDVVNLLDYAHARNTPLPQYHPRILLDLMNSGKLSAVKAILSNLIKYLLIYDDPNRRGKSSDEDENFTFAEFDEKEEEERHSKKRMLSISSDGQLRRSRKIGPKITVETIPSLSLTQLGIFNKSTPSPEGQQLVEGRGEESVEAEEEDDLFSFAVDVAATPREGYNFNFEEEEEKELVFNEIDPTTSDFTPEMATKLSSILQYAVLSDLSDLEQVRLMAIAETVANTKMWFEIHEEQGSVTTPSDPDSIGMVLGLTSGAGYASTTLASGGEAMDDCGLRYLLALQNYTSLLKSLPPGVQPGYLAPSDFVWAFHSDAELELLAAIPSVQRDELTWAELRNAGVGWWVRSPETLRRLMEKLAKTQFMISQSPLEASLLYLAMKKKSLLKGLFRTVGESRMTQFFAQDFTQERWKKAALKNAFALLSKQRFEQAAAFFLLGDKLWDACEVCISRLGDLQLSIVITRLYEGDGGPIYQRIVKEYILGISTAVPIASKGVVAQLDPSPDPFLRSIACWLLQDYSSALETLLANPEQPEGDLQSAREDTCVVDPNIFNFYFYLRSHPLLIRRNQYNYRSRAVLTDATKSLPKHLPSSSYSYQQVSSIGEEPLTAMERKLLFSTAYHHLNHGCPLLALDVLSKLPKSSGLGADLNDDKASSNKDGFLDSGGSVSSTLRLNPTASVTGMIQSGTLGEFAFGSTPAKGGDGGEEEEFDWSHPIRSQKVTMEEDEIDWLQPVSSQRLNGGGREEVDDANFDWSQPVSSHSDLLGTIPPLSPPHFGRSETDSGSLPKSSHTSGSSGIDAASSPALSSQAFFVLSLAKQLQYNACLSILTEELNVIHIPLCCEYLWKEGGRQALPLLPLAKRGDNKSLSLHHREDAFEKTVLSLRGMLVIWLRREMATVKAVCGFEKNAEEVEEAPTEYVPAGYDLLTTLMNYVSLHAGTSPSLITVKLELMHLMNTLLPWSTSPTNINQELEGDDLASLPSGVPICAFEPSQLPILTSCSLPAKHLTNLALHLRLMSASIVEMLANHMCPPIASKPLPQVAKVFELCCAISHSITVCLSPMSFAEIASALFTATGGSTSGGSHDATGASTPQAQVSGTHIHPESTSTQGSSELRYRSRLSSRTPQNRPRSNGSFSFTMDVLESLGRPNTKPSKWPGVAKWPKSLQSDEGKDPTPLSMILAECCVAVYMGLLSVAWSRHSIHDLFLLLKNSPDKDFWHQAFGGGMGY